jgi:membrane protein HdeD
MLAASIMSALPAIGKYIAKLTKFLGGFQVIIGIIALVGGIIVLL